MFDPINGPTNHYEGPATGHSTEKGDSWHTAVKKINEGFAKVIKAIEAPFSDAQSVEIVDTEARKEIAELREIVAAQQMALDTEKAKSEHFESVLSDYAFKVDAIISAMKAPQPLPPTTPPEQTGVEATANG